MRLFGYSQPNIEFREGFFENLQVFLLSLSHHLSLTPSRFSLSPPLSRTLPLPIPLPLPSLFCYLSSFSSRAICFHSLFLFPSCPLPLPYSSFI